MTGSLRWQVSAVSATLVAVFAWTQLGAGDAGAATAKAAGKKVTISTRSFQISGAQANDPQRLVVRCKRGYRPIGGGIFGTPPVGAGGIGIYPTSSERLGVQEGWHSGATLFDEDSAVPAGRRATLQAFCARLAGDIDPVPSTVLVDPGDFRTAISVCPKGKTLISGGFFSTQFFPGKGVYTTESRRIDKRTWQASAYGVATGKGGSLTSLAYCLGGRKPVLRELSAPGTVALNGVGTATTPACPGKHPLAVGGFAGPTSGALRFFDTYAAGGGSWSASAFGVKGASPFTAYAYCLLRATGPRGHGGKPTQSSAPIVFSGFRQPPSPHGAGYTVDVSGSSVGKYRGNRSHSPFAVGCLSNRRVTLEPRYKDPTTGPIPAGQVVVTRSDGGGNFSAKVPVTLPANRTQPALLSIIASFDGATRRIKGQRVNCEPGGELRPTYQAVGT